MEVTSASSTSYEEAVANSAPVDEVIFPKLFTPFVQKVPFSSAPLGSGFMIVDLKADGGCVIQAVYKKLATTGVLVKAVDSSNFPTIVYFDEANATILLLTEEGKAALSREYPDDVQLSSLLTPSTRREDPPPSSTSSSQDPMFIVDSKKLSEDKANRDALLALTNFNRSFVESYAAKAVNSDTLLPALAQLSNKNFYLKVFPLLFDNRM